MHGIVRENRHIAGNGSGTRLVSGLTVVGCRGAVCRDVDLAGLQGAAPRLALIVHQRLRVRRNPHIQAVRRLQHQLCSGTKRAPSTHLAVSRSAFEALPFPASSFGRARFRSTTHSVLVATVSPDPPVHCSAGSYIADDLPIARLMQTFVIDCTTMQSLSVCTPCNLSLQGGLFVLSSEGIVL